MKFRKRDIDKIINILQIKKEELKEFDDNIQFEIINNKLLIHAWKEPTEFAVKANNEIEGKLLGEYVDNKYKQHQWLKSEVNTQFYLHIRNGNYWKGDYEVEKDFVELSFNEFQEYILNK